MVATSSQKAIFIVYRLCLMKQKSLATKICGKQQLPGSYPSSKKPHSASLGKHGNSIFALRSYKGCNTYAPEFAHSRWSLLL